MVAGIFRAGRHLIDNPRGAPRIWGMFCPKCGREAADDQAFCANCGASLGQAAPAGARQGDPNTPGAPAGPAAGISPKSRLTATLLCAIPALFGLFGIHRIYIGKVGTGIAMIVLSVAAWATVWFLVGVPIFVAVLVWAIIDFANVVTGRMYDSDGLLIDRW